MPFDSSPLVESAPYPVAVRPVRRPPPPKAAPALGSMAVPAPPSATLTRPPKTGCSAAWLARLLWEQEAGSSNLPTPTTSDHEPLPAIHEPTTAVASTTPGSRACFGSRRPGVRISPPRPHLTATDDLRLASIHQRPNPPRSRPVRRFSNLRKGSRTSGRRRQESVLDAEIVGAIADQRVVDRHDERTVRHNGDGKGFGSKPVQASTRNERRHHRNEKARSDEPDPVRQVVDPLTGKIFGKAGELPRHRTFAAAAMRGVRESGSTKQRSWRRPSVRSQLLATRSGRPRADPAGGWSSTTMATARTRLQRL